MTHVATPPTMDDEDDDAGRMVHYGHHGGRSLAPGAANGGVYGATSQEPGTAIVGPDTKTMSATLDRIAAVVRGKSTANNNDNNDNGNGNGNDNNGGWQDGMMDDHGDNKSAPAAAAATSSPPPTRPQTVREWENILAQLKQMRFQCETKIDGILSEMVHRRSGVGQQHHDHNNNNNNNQRAVPHANRQYAHLPVHQLQAHLDWFEVRNDRVTDLVREATKSKLNLELLDDELDDSDDATNGHASPGQHQVPNGKHSPFPRGSNNFYRGRTKSQHAAPSDLLLHRRLRPRRRRTTPYANVTSHHRWWGSRDRERQMRTPYDDDYETNDDEVQAQKSAKKEAQYYLKQYYARNPDTSLMCDWYSKTTRRF